MIVYEGARARDDASANSSRLPRSKGWMLFRAILSTNSLVFDRPEPSQHARHRSNKLSLHFGADSQFSTAELIEPLDFQSQKQSLVPQTRRRIGRTYLTHIAVERLKHRLDIDKVVYARPQFAPLLSTRNFMDIWIVWR